jgi:hypothetical protein
MENFFPVPLIVLLDNKKEDRAVSHYKEILKTG